MSKKCVCVTFSCVCSIAKVCLLLRRAQNTSKVTQIFFCEPTVWPSRHQQPEPDINHLSSSQRHATHTSHTPPPKPHQTTQDRGSVREWLAIDMKCVTKYRVEPHRHKYTHIVSSAQTSQPSSQVEAAVNSWHATQDHNGGQLFSKGTSPERKTSSGVRATVKVENQWTLQ